MCTLLHYFKKSSLVVAFIPFIFYTVWMVYSLQYKDVHDSIYIGNMYIQQSKVSKIINDQNKYSYKFNGTGYDGQFYYYIALDPINAHYYMDYPAYRYMRILYPLLAKLLALDNKNIISYSLLVINIFSIALGVFFIGLWLSKQNYSPWYALGYGFYPGLYISLQRDTAEPLAYAFIALGIYCLYYSRFKVLLSGVFFAAAILTRETTVIFPLAYLIFLLLKHYINNNKISLSIKPKQIFLLLAISLIPFLIYKFFLLIWLESFGLRAKENIGYIPLKGLLSFWPWVKMQLDQFYSIVLPAIISFIYVIIYIWRKHFSPELLALFVNVLLIIFLGKIPYEDYNATLRIATGVTLATFFCLPIINRISKFGKMWLLIIIIFWYKIWTEIPPLFTTNTINILIFYLSLLFLLIEVIKRLFSKNYR